MARRNSAHVIRVLALVFCVDAAVLMRLHHPQPGILLTGRGTAVRMQIGGRWSQKRAEQKEAERAKYAEIAAAREAAEEKRLAQVEAQQQQKREEAEAKARKAAAYQDSFDYFQPGVAGQGKMGQPSGMVTREMLQNSEKTTSPALVADEQLKQAVADAGKYSVDASRAMLERCIAEARVAGLREAMPNMKKAVALLATLQRAEAAEQDQPPKVESDPQADMMAAIFDGGYAMPADDGVEFDPIDEE